MKNQSIVTRTELLTQSNYQVWVQAIARALYQSLNLPFPQQEIEI
ncbi:MAG: hypothetical protein PUP93_16275 [Rhizonema sp. NSF051]|nr:hypothetical protein [Rhizonema sp. NSF051]